MSGSFRISGKPKSTTEAIWQVRQENRSQTLSFPLATSARRHEGQEKKNFFGLAGQVQRRDFYLSHPWLEEAARNSCTSVNFLLKLDPKKLKEQEHLQK